MTSTDKNENSVEEKISPNDEQLDDGSMPLTSHLEELRSRIIKSLLAVVVGSCISYFFLDEITKFLTEPVGKLYYMQPGEAFFTYLKIDIVAGFLIALPIIFFHVWKFFLPALTKSERAALGILVPSSVILFFGGLQTIFKQIFQQNFIVDQPKVEILYKIWLNMPTYSAKTPC